MARETVIIDHPSELDRFRVIPGLRSPGLGRIQLSGGQGLDPETRSNFEQRLNGLYFACGCDTAALFIAIALIGYGALAAMGEANIRGYAPWVTGFLVLVAAAALGKFVGKLRAERKFREAVAELKRVWRVPTRKSEEISSCG